MSIDWNLTVEIDQSVLPPRARVFGDHDDFPAYEVYVDGQPVYQWKPPAGYTVLRLCANPVAAPQIPVNTDFIPIR